MENKKYKLSSVLALFFFVLFCGSTFLNYKLSGYLDEYDEQVERQDSMIRKLSFSNDLVKEYFDIEEDSITHNTTYSLKENKKEIEKVTERVTKYVEPEFVRNGKKISSEELVAAINAKDKESVEAINSLANKYNTLVQDYNDLAKKMKMKSDTVDIQSMALGLIKRNYGIDYTSTLNGDTRTVHVQGNKVDSALMLLPYYRHKLTYDSKTKSWMVEVKKK